MKSFSASLSFSVLHTLPYDLIIGRKSIILYDLWNKTLVVDPTMFQLPPVRLSRLKSATKTSKKPTRVRKPLRAPNPIPEQQTKNQLHLQNTVETSTAIEGRPSDVAHKTTRTAESVKATTISTPHPSPVDTKNKGPAALLASERVEIMKETRIPTCPRGTKCRCAWYKPCDSIGLSRMRDAYNAAVSSENHLSTNPRKVALGSHRGELGAGLSVAAGSVGISHEWEATSTEQLLAFLDVKSSSDGAIRPPTQELKSNRYRDTNFSRDVNRRVNPL